MAGGAGLSWLDFMQALMGKTPPPPIALLLNMRPTKVDRGLAVCECIPDESVYNLIGLVHGGLECTLADSVPGCAVHATLTTAPSQRHTPAAVSSPMTSSAPGLPG